MNKRIAVETLTLKEAAALFYESLEPAYPKFKTAVDVYAKKLKKVKKTRDKWVKTYEEIKGAKINFYTEFTPDSTAPIVGSAMVYRSTRGLLLIAADTSYGGVQRGVTARNTRDKWVRIYTEHCCERYAERILNAENPTFQTGSEGIMFADLAGPVRVTDMIADGVEEIEFQFKGGQAYGYRDGNSNIVYLKTFYSDNMLKGERGRFRDDWKDTLQQLHDYFGWS